jgi:nitrile hydratase accessory protein
MTDGPALDASKLADLPLLPRDADGPVFAEPWQAQAFAVVVELTDRGILSRDEWAERLGAALADAEGRGETDTGQRYYDHWLAALERVVVEKNLAAEDELLSEGETLLAGDHHRREDQLHGGHSHDDDNHAAHDD